MRPVFYVAVDNVVHDFAVANQPLHEIGERFPLYFLASGEGTGAIRREFPRCTVLKAKNDFQIKGRKFFKYIQQQEIACDCVVRLDVDALVFDIDWLLRIFKTHLMASEFGFIGNMVTRGKGKRYIRGACQAVTHKLAMKMDLQPTGSSKEFDYMFTNAAYIAGCEFIPYKLFNVSKLYTYSVPVWHPPKFKLSDRFLYFKNHLNRYRRYKKYRKA